MSCRWKLALRDTELRLYGALVLTAVGILTATLLTHGSYDGVGDAVSHAAFQVASIVTTTGFATVDFDAWPDFARLLLVMLMFGGACAGSTAGGIKIVRIAVAAKFMLRQLHSHINPRAVEPLRIGGSTVSEDVARAVIGMVLLFVAAFAGGALTLGALGLGMTEAVTASIAALGNIGPGLGAVGPAGNYADLPALGKLVLTALMLVGRLEIFTALSLFLPSLWRD